MLLCWRPGKVFESESTSFLVGGGYKLLKSTVFINLDRLGALELVGGLRSESMGQMPSRMPSAAAMSLP